MKQIGPRHKPKRAENRPCRFLISFTNEQFEQIEAFVAACEFPTSRQAVIETLVMRAIKNWTKGIAEEAELPPEL